MCELKYTIFKMPIIRAVGFAFKSLSQRAFGWAVHRQQKWVQRLSTKRRSRNYNDLCSSCLALRREPSSKPESVAVPTASSPKSGRKKRKSRIVCQKVRHSRRKLRAKQSITLRCSVTLVNPLSDTGNGPSHNSEVRSANRVDDRLETMSLENMDYFHDVNRSTAEKMLHSHGMFLIRPSTHLPNTLTLDLFTNGDISHIHIRVREDGKYALGRHTSNEQAFDSVMNLVEYHRKVPIKKEADGSKTILLGSPTRT